MEYSSTDEQVLIATTARDLKVNNGGGIWRSADGGKSWYKPPTSVYQENGVPKPSHGFGIAFEQESKRVYVGTEFGVAVSNDNGDTWVHYRVDQKLVGYSFRIAKVYSLVSTGKDHAIAATSLGMYLSRDGGVNWKPSSTALSKVSNVRGLAVSPLNNQHVFMASSDYKLYYSPDEGQNWAEIKSPGGGNREPFIRCLRQEGSRNLVLYFGNGVDLYRKNVAVRPDGTLDFGTSWDILALDHKDPADLISTSNKIEPILLSGDGGVFTTPDRGQTWNFAGGGDNCLNALQITEVTGQENFEGKRKSFVYFGTQDNYVWASSDGAKNWTAASGGEGFSIQTKRIALLPAGNLMTYVTCADCEWKVSEQGLASEKNWKAPAGAIGDPVIWPTDALDPEPRNRFVQLSKGLEDASGNFLRMFNVTNDGGGAWKAVGNMNLDPMPQLPQISSPTGGAVLYQSVALPGKTKQGDQKIGLVKLPTLYGNSNTQVERADLGGFGSLGIFVTMFKWYNVFAVNPLDPNHLIIADVENEKMKVSWDGGKNWYTDDELTDLVTDCGRFKFYETVDCCPKIVVTCIAFNPDDPAQIAVGTRENGIIYSRNKGESWAKLNDTERIVNPSSIYFLFNSKKIMVSSYGRGLWEFEPEPRETRPCPGSKYAPKGAFFVDVNTVKISRLHDVDSLLGNDGIRQLVVPSGDQILTLAMLLEQRPEALTLANSVWYQPARKTVGKLEINLSYEISFSVAQLADYTDLSIRGYLVGANNNVLGFVLSKEDFQVFSKEESALPPLVAPYLVVGDERNPYPFTAEAGSNLSIKGVNFRPCTAGAPNAVKLYIGNELYREGIAVDQQGVFSIAVQTDETMKDGMTIRAVQTNPDQTLEDIRWVQIRRKGDFEQQKRD